MGSAAGLGPTNFKQAARCPIAEKQRASSMPGGVIGLQASLLTERYGMGNALQ